MAAPGFRYSGLGWDEKSRQRPRTYSRAKAVNITRIDYNSRKISSTS